MLQMFPPADHLAVSVAGTVSSARPPPSRAFLRAALAVSLARQRDTHTRLLRPRGRTDLKEAGPEAAGLHRSTLLVVMAGLLRSATKVVMRGLRLVTRLGHDMRQTISVALPACQRRLVSGHHENAIRGTSRHSGAYTRFGSFAASCLAGDSHWAPHRGCFVVFVISPIPQADAELRCAQSQA